MDTRLHPSHLILELGLILVCGLDEGVQSSLCRVSMEGDMPPQNRDLELQQLMMGQLL